MAHMGTRLKFILSVAVVGLCGAATLTLASNSHSLALESTSSQYASGVDSTLLDLGSALTLEAWVKLESHPIDGGEFSIVSKWDFENDQRAYRLAYAKNDGSYRIRFATSATCTDFAEGDTVYTLDLDRWYHIAVSKQGTVANVFLDGQLVNTVSTTESLCDSTASLGIGASIASSPALFLDGNIDDVRIWNVARTGAEIAANRAVELGGNEAGLVGYWKLNGDLSDSSGNGHTLVNNGGAAFSSDTPFDAVPPVSEILSAYKTADESATSTTLQADDHLMLALKPDTVYAIEGALFVSATHARPDMVFSISAPLGADAVLGYLAEDAGGVLRGPSERIQVPAHETVPIFIKGTVMTDAAGAVQLSWAQAQQHASSVTLRKESYLRAFEL